MESLAYAETSSKVCGQKGEQSNRRAGTKVGPEGWWFYLVLIF